MYLVERVVSEYEVYFADFLDIFRCYTYFLFYFSYCSFFYRVVLFFDFTSRSVDVSFSNPAFLFDQKYFISVYYIAEGCYLVELFRAVFSFYNSKISWINGLFGCVAFPSFSDDTVLVYSFVLK